MWILVLLLGVGVVTVALLAILALGLIRQLKVLRDSLAAFQDEVRPLLERINRDGNRAQSRLQELADQGQELSNGRFGGRAGARIRR